MIKNLCQATAFALLAALSFQCTKRSDCSNCNPDASGINAAFILNEGGFGQNNSTLTLYDFGLGQAVTDLFEQQNQRKLGDTGNDLVLYNGRLYAIINGSNTLEVINPNNGKSIAQKSLGRLSPRKIALTEGKAFIVGFNDSLLVLDASSLGQLNKVKIGTDPDGITVSGGKLWVTQSGGLNFPNYDSTVIVLNTSTLATEKTINVGINPGPVYPYKDGAIVLTRGNYGSVPARLVMVDQAGAVSKPFNNLRPDEVTSNDSLLYMLARNGANQRRIFKVRLSTLQIVDTNFTNIADITYPYELGIDPSNGDLYITDARDFVSRGKVAVVNKNGQRRYNFETGINPGSIVFTRR